MGNKPSKEISRRDAIKIFAAVAGATALVNLPDKWTKPGMEVGVLPAHAQTSLHTLVAGPNDPGANFCTDPNLTSIVQITPPTSGIVMRYVITPSNLVRITLPAPTTGPTSITGTALTGALGASLSITVDNYPTMAPGDTVTVTWSFENASDGTGSDSQVFTNTANGC